MKKNKKIKAYLLRLLTNKKNSSFDIKKSKKVLILKYDRIGDMIVTTPIFRELKNAYPNCSLSVLASEENKDVIKYNPYIDNIYVNYKKCTRTTYVCTYMCTCTCTTYIFFFCL